MDLPDCVRIEQIATHTINGIRGVSDHPSLSKNLHHLSNQSDLRILRIDREYHGLSSLHAENWQPAEKVMLCRLPKKGPAFAEAASRRQADGSCALQNPVNGSSRNLEE